MEGKVTWPGDILAVSLRGCFTAVGVSEMGE